MSLSYDSQSYALIKSELRTHFIKYASFPQLINHSLNTQLPSRTWGYSVTVHTAVSHKCTCLGPVSSWVMISHAHVGLGEPWHQRHIAFPCRHVYSVCLQQRVQGKRMRGPYCDSISAHGTATSQSHSRRAVLNLVRARVQLSSVRCKVGCQFFDLSPTHEIEAIV
jgi:hypothetical protein